MPAINPTARRQGDGSPVRLDRLVTLAGLAALKGADDSTLFPQSTVRGWMERDLRGFRQRCVVKVGGKAMVDLDALDGWLESQRGAKQERELTERSAPAATRRHRRDVSEVLAAAGFAPSAARPRRASVQARGENTVAP